MYEILVTDGEYAGHFVSVCSLDSARAEFGDAIDETSLRERAPAYTVILHTRTDGDVVWQADLSLEAARAEVAELARQGRAASFERAPE
jgi:hypothetical protein